MIKEHLPLSKDKPYLLTSWLSMVAFEDIPEFAELTGTVPQHLIQSLMYRMEEIGKTVQYTDYHRTKNEKNLEVLDY